MQKQTQKPQQIRNIPQVNFKLTANELLFFPQQYDPTPVRQMKLIPDDLVRKKNYLEKIQKKSSNEKRQFRAERDARYLHQNGKKSVDKEGDEKMFCLDHLVGRCRSNDCGRWHQMRHQRLFGACKYYISGVCKNGDLCQYMHEDFPCRYYYLDLEHPKSVEHIDCRFKHAGPLSLRLRQHFRKQIEIWVKDITKNNPGQFDETLNKFQDLFDTKQSKLEQEYAIENPGNCSNSSSEASDGLTLESFLSSVQIKRLAERNITTAVQINQIPIDELLDYGLTVDQIYRITTNTCSESSPPVNQRDISSQNVLSIDNLNLNIISSLETSDNSFQGFSEVDMKDALETLTSKQLVLQVNKRMDEDDLKDECNRKDAEHQEDVVPDESDDSDNEFNLVINEEEFM